MIKRTTAAVIFFLALGHASAADWKADLLSFLGPRPDYRQAMDFLAGRAKSLEGADLQVAEALLPYLASKLGETVEEQDLISGYFEKYLDNDPEFGFLDDLTIRDFLVFWARWKSAYPLVSDLNLLAYPGRDGSDLPASLDIGLEVLSGAYYKLSLGPYTLEGGFWPKGFHILTIPVAGLLGRSGTYTFLLDLMIGDLIVRKPVGIVVDLTTVASARPAATDMPRVENGRTPAPRPPAASNLEGELSLYVGGKLIMKSRKLATRMPPLNIPLGGPSMPGTKPYLPPPKTNPMASSVSILDAIALAYKAFKDLLAKKPPVPPAPSYQKVSSLSFSFVRAGEDGASSDSRATVRLDKSRAAVLRR